MVLSGRVHMAIGALGVSLAAFSGAVSAPPAAADPVPPADPVVLPAPVPAPPAAPAADPLTPPDGMSHLPSPDSLPPGTTQVEPEHPKLGFLRDIWNAVRGKDLSASDALLLIAQRPGDPGKLAASVPSNQVGPVPAELPAPAAPAAQTPSAEPAPAAPAPAPVPAA